MARDKHNKFKEAYQVLVIDMFSKGASMADFCVKVGHHRETVYEWMRKYPSFKNAYKLAREFAKSHRDNTAKEHMWQSYGEEGQNFDVKSYLKLTEPRFKDLQREMPAPEILEDNDNPDLYKAVRQLIKATTTETISIDQSKSITAMINAAVSIKEKEVLAKTLADIEKIIQNGQLNSNSPVVAPVAEFEEVERDDNKTE